MSGTRAAVAATTAASNDCAPHLVAAGAGGGLKRLRSKPGGNRVMVVLGTQWGDEGKGKVVDLLATEADVICRCQKPKHPTTGLIAMAFAFHICSQVHLAGFRYNFSDRNSSLHYYGNDTMSLMIQNEYHDIAAEQKFLKELMDRNLVVNLTEE